MAPRIKYNNIVVELDDSWNAYNDSIGHRRGELQAGSGVSEFLNSFSQQVVTAERRLATSQQVAELNEFFDYVKDGTTFEFWRDYNLAYYIPFEGKSLNSTDGDVGTFSRGSETGDPTTFLNPDSGLVESPGTGLPRFPAGKYGKGILIEGSVQNLIGSDYIEFQNWTASGSMTVSTNTTETTDPKGTNTADKLTSSSTAQYVEYTTSTAVGNNVAFGVYLKAPSGSVTVELSIRGTTTGTASQNKTVVSNGNDGEGFTYFGFTTDTSGWSGNLKARITIVTSSGEVYAWGALLVDNIKFVPTVTSPSHNAESVLYPTTKMNRDKGTISFWFKPQWNAGENGGNALFHSGVDTGTNRHISYYILPTGNHELRFYSGDGGIAASFEGATGFAKDTWYHIAITYDSTVSNGLNLYVDGSLVGISSNDAFNPDALGSNFAVGSFVNGGNPAFGVIDDIEVWRDVKDASWVNQTYNYGRGKGYTRNYYSSVILDSYEKNERPNGFFDVAFKMKEELT